MNIANNNRDIDEWQETFPWYDEISQEQEDRPIRTPHRPKDEDDQELVDWVSL
jgi:hypothetical protein